jgi:hypothetical protein
VRDSVAEKIVTLKDSKRRDVVIVAHGVFMKYLVGDPEIDLPKAGWKSYTTEKDATRGSICIPI